MNPNEKENISYLAHNKVSNMEKIRSKIKIHLNLIDSINNETLHLTRPSSYTRLKSYSLMT